MVSTLSSKEELMVLMAVKEKKEATLGELQTYIADKWNTKITEDNLTRYLRRWKKGKVIVAGLVNKEWMYSLRDIPWYPEAQMIHVCEPDVTETEAKEFLANYKDELGERSYISERVPDIRDYESYRVTFETIDHIAGGLQSGDEHTLIFPRRNGTPYIPRNWIKGYHRWNVRLININESFGRERMAYSIGEFVEEPKIAKISAIGKNGPVTYETVPPGSRFTFVVRFPTHGSSIKGKEDFEKLYKMCEDAPLRGFGAYDSAFGGRVKLVEMKEV